jgi:sodium transport system permease protein
LVPSTLLGLVLGGLCWKTGSVFPGMALHACHNAILVLVAYYQKEIAEQGWFDPEQASLPASWLFAAGILATLGLLLIQFALPRAKVDDQLEKDQVEVRS